MARSEFRETDENRENGTRYRSDQQRRAAEAGAWGSYGPDRRDLTQDTTESPQSDKPVRRETPTLKEARQADIVHEAIEAFTLDPESQEAARQYGEMASRRCSSEKWKSADFFERRQIFQDLVGTGETTLNLRQLSTEVSEATGPAAARRNGRLKGGQTLEVNESLLLRDDPSQLIETVAHECRHSWQFDVIAGIKEHPDGDSMRDFLDNSHHEYKETEPGELSYFLNGMELDARAFARIARRTYSSLEEDR